jgi:DNA-binding NtrC family response regulator
MKNEIQSLVERLLGGDVSLSEAIELVERGMVAGALERHKGNQCAASKQLGIHRNTFQRKMVEYGLGTSRPRARRKPVVRAGRPSKRKTGAA